MSTNAAKPKSSPSPQEKQVRAKVIAALRALRGASPDAAPIKFLICVAQKGCAVYMDKTVGPSHRPLLQALLPGDTGFKFFTGDCIWEKNTHTFVGENMPAGLAKRLQAAIFDLTGARLKVRLRRDTGEVEEMEGETDLDETEGEERGKQVREASGDAFEALQARAAQVAATLAKAAAAGYPHAEAMKQKLKQALISAKDTASIAESARTVEAIAKALDAARSTASAGKPGATATSGAAASAGKAGAPAAAEQAWKKARDAWRASIETADGQIEAVRGKMMATGDAEFKRIADIGLPALTGNHKTPVMRALLEIEDSIGDARRKAAEKALASVAAFRKHLETDPMVRVLDTHSKAAFGVELTIRRVVGAGLESLDGALRKMTAA